MKNTKHIIATLFVLLFVSSVLTAAEYKKFSDYAEGEGHGDNWWVHLDMYYPKNYDDATAKKQSNFLMKDLCDTGRKYAAEIAYLSQYVSEYTLKDGTTYRVVFYYFISFDDGQVAVFKGADNLGHEISMEMIYKTEFIKGVNNCNDEYKRQCKKYLDMM